MILRTTTQNPDPPSLRIRKVYETEFCPRTFDEDLQLHLSNGYVHSTPEVFVMGRPVWSQATYSEITNPGHRFMGPDAWWVYAAAGDLSQVAALLPYYLPLVGWERLNVPRFYDLNRVIQLCTIDPLRMAALF